ncbi:HORMA-domain-containing protein [Laetiporus sulphureus 93-53]|uniref:HORMA-domain-containing protein n=1 Tax=Laetiporus sulphureus 93-53 TaxID=1314785 RepID=A0A165FZA9_9APHY|nr:HORMA-domain-containing protein [Laetiporus sulphureus 93-53]KZT09612.1 HORMA-domain-containing protein [Laetiporus sulphureus 93-53]
MQAQAIRTDQNQAVLTSQQSLQSIQTMLKAGLGCITYLRNLLPCDNFSESYLTSCSPGILSSQPSGTTESCSSEDDSRKRRNISGFKIMTVTRGFTEEADRLLDYLENGIFDALQKQYLRSCIFAVYLDSQDPNNIVEAYTFSFEYHKISGTDVVVPVMSLDADLEKLSISGGKIKGIDPVTDASRHGRIPTLGDVKRSLKTLIKNLIQATTQMDALPKRRFATFKLFYHEHTPDDYEPPHFQPGDAKKDKWFFSTHDKGEVPEKCSIGSLQTGFHGVDVRVTSVSGYLPSVEDNNAPFLGTTNAGEFSAPILRPADEAATRLQQAQIQRDDALERRVVWDGDDGLCDVDAEGEDDPDYVPGSTPGVGGPFGIESVALIGIRTEEGNIIPLPEKAKRQIGSSAGRDEEAQYAGKHDTVPNGVAQLPKHNGLKSRRIISPENSLPPSDIVPESLPSISSVDPTQTLDTQLVQNMIVDAYVGGEDDEMLDTETQVMLAASSIEDSIRSFSGNDNGQSQILPCTHEETATNDIREGYQGEGALDCECGVTIEDDDLCLCDGGCKRWFHTWCMGYHSAKDKRMPAQFICFDCRVKADQNWDLIVVHDLYPRMMERFRDLAIFRRAIKQFETRKPDSLSAFTKLMGCDPAVAGQLFKRLEAEGFIAIELRETDDLGLMETATRMTKAKNKGKMAAKTRQSQRKKALQKPKYIFLQASTQSQAYKDYFDPDPEVEKRLLSLSDLKPRRKSHKKQAVDEPHIEMTGPQAGQAMNQLVADVQMQDVMIAAPPVLPIQCQTQEETQAAQCIAGRNQNCGVDAGELKRKNNEGTEQLPARPSKKVKISVGPAVDLGD